MMRQCQRVFRTIAVLLVASFLAAGCSQQAEPPAPTQKVLFVGIDALDWEVADPLMEEGKLPNLTRLIAEGTSADILTLIPLTRSPAIWTTIGTGKEPSQHGIGAFVEDDEATPVTRSGRLTKALWNILSAAGIDVGVVGWWVTWPSEPVNGFMVSDYVQYNFSDTELYEGQTYPEDLIEEIDELTVPHDQMSFDVLEPFVEGHPTDHLKGKYAQGMEALRWIVAADRTFTSVGLHLYKTRKPQFFTVYLRGLDSVCHKYWHEFKAPEPTGSPFRNTVPYYYEFADSLLGEFLAVADENTTVLVCSDHGFRGARMRWDGTPALGIRMHREYGAIIMAGPGVPAGQRIENVTVLDVTPTLLYFFGLPVAEDMRGVAVMDFFTPEFREARSLQTIDTYETPGEGGEDEVMESPVDDELVRRLKALGYIQ
jgi:predicted AlkP superfamily phosphohydrolase/phosphomutase